jgi:hypothetical protein
MGRAHLVTIAFILTLPLVAAAGAPAADHRVPVDNAGFTIDAADCGFPIDVAIVTDKEYIVKIRDNADGSTTFRLAGRLIVSFTNTDSGTTIVRNVSGPGRLTVSEDHGLFDGYGPGFTWLSPEEQALTGLPGLTFTYGHFVVPVDADFSATGASLAGRFEDGCALLAG